jgi:hypothetical protein
MFTSNHTRRLVASCALLALAGLGTACGGEVEQNSKSNAIRSGPSSEGSGHNRAPEASFDVETKLPEQGDVVSFDATDSRDPDGDALDYDWTFGDGKPGSGSKISHIYAEGGSYDITLTVTDPEGLQDSVTRSVGIKDKPYPKGESRIHFIVRDVHYADLEGVTISPVGFDVTKTTDDEGEATFETMPAKVPLIFKLSKKGYADQVKRIALPRNDGTVPLHVRMKTVDDRVTVGSIEDGGEAVSIDGARVEFPPTSVVDAEGRPVEGSITVEFTTFDVSEKPYMDAFPGAFLGVEPGGDATQIRSVGAMNVELTQNGEPLRIAAGKRAEIEIPTYVDGAPLDETVPLWSLDESTGVWMQEGALDVVESEDSPTDRAMRAKVGHFSSWNGDYPLTTPCKMKPRCVIEDDDGNDPIPLKRNELCEVTVTSQQDSARGVGGGCTTNFPEVSGQSCDSATDCEYDYEKCTGSGDSRECEMESADAPGFECYTGNTAGGQDISSSVSGDGVCKETSNSCSNAQFCSASGDASSSENSNGSPTSGNCSLPGQNGVFQNANSQYNATFIIDAKGNRVSTESSGWGIEDPDASNNWLWVPNVGLDLTASARDGTLVGTKSVDGNDSANKDWEDGTAHECKVPRPRIKMNHTCNNVCGECEVQRLEHVCELMFRCPKSAFTRNFTQGARGVPTKEACKEILRNDFQKGLLQDEIDRGHAEYNGFQAARCLDQVADMRHDADNSFCEEFSREAWDLKACTGVVGLQSTGESCRHDLECHGSDVYCKRQQNSGSNQVVVDFDGNQNDVSDFRNMFTREREDGIHWDDQGSHIRWADDGSSYGGFKSNPGMFKYYVDLPSGTRRLVGELHFDGHSFEDSGYAFYAVDENGNHHMVSCDHRINDVGGVSCPGHDRNTVGYDGSFNIAASAELEKFYVVSDMENVHGTFYDESELHRLKVESLSSGAYGICVEDETTVENCSKEINGRTTSEQCDRETEYCKEFVGQPNKEPECMTKGSVGDSCRRSGECMPNLYCNVSSGQETGTCRRQQYKGVGNTCGNQNRDVCVVGSHCSFPHDLSDSSLECRRYASAGESCLALDGRAGASGCRWNAYCDSSNTTYLENDFEGGGIGNWTSDDGDSLVRRGSGNATSDPSVVAPDCDRSDDTSTITRTGLDIDDGNVYFEARVVPFDSWDSETVRMQFHDDSGWNTVARGTAQWNGYDSDPYDSSCPNANWNSDSAFEFEGTFSVDGSIDKVRFVETAEQSDFDESLGIDEILISSGRNANNPSAGTCKSSRDSGASCTSDDECLSGYCSNGYCVGPDTQCN